MKWAIFFMAFVVSFLKTHAGQYFYWVDFSNPHQVNQPPVTNAGPRTPSRIVFGSPTVVSSFGHLNDQPLLFKGTYYEQIQFDLNKGVPDYFIDFDFETQNLNPSLFAFGLVCDTPPPFVPSFSLHGLDFIGVPNAEHLPGWADDEQHRAQIYVNLTSNYWTFRLDDRPAAIGPFSTGSEDIISTRFNLSAWRGFTSADPNVQVAIDNVRIGTSVPAPPPTISCPAPITLECEKGIATLNAVVQDSSTTPLTVIWFVDGIPYQTNNLPKGAAITPVNVTFAGDFGTGEHSVVLSGFNGDAGPATCSTTVTVLDKTAPTISKISATPTILWPPNGQMIPVKIQVNARDTCGPTTCKILTIRSNGPDADWEITGDLTLRLRAVRLGQTQTRIYNVIVQCEDAAGNTTMRSVDVTVLHDRSNNTTAFRSQLKRFPLFREQRLFHGEPGFDNR